MKRYIDADKIDWRMIKPINPNVADEHMIYQARKLVESQPTADVVEVKHGKWIPRTNLPKQEIFICSVCGGWAYSPWIGSRKKPKPNWCKYKYCPSCGAKMEVQSEI